MEQKISQKVFKYINRRPYIKEVIEQEIVNYSALARKIAKEIGANFEAVKASLLRHSKKIRKNREERERKIVELLRKSSFSIRNKVVALHSSSFINVESIAYSKTPSGYMYFIDENHAKELGKKAECGYAIINIKSNREIEDMPGVAAFLLSSLASAGINVKHLMDCREDTFLVVKEEDAPHAFKILAESLRPST